MVREPTCDRARTWLSLQLDGELSELEGALLSAHLARCEPCRAAAAGIEAVTCAIRAVPLELPSVALSVPRLRARGSLRAFYSAAAATLGTVVLLTGVGSVGAMHVIGQNPAAPKLERVSAVANGMSDDLQLLAGVRVQRVERPIPGRIVWPA